MTHMKSKLLVAVAMLIVASVMMTTATYAWFTISTNPEISNISADITANGNLEIQLADVTAAGTATSPVFATMAKASAVGDSGQNETWGNLIDLDTAFESTSGNAITLRPVLANIVDGTGTDKNVNITFEYPTFGLDGRIKTTDDLKAKVAADGSTSTFADNGGVVLYQETSENGYTWCFEVDYWIRTNVAGTVTLEAPDDSTGNNGDNMRDNNSEEGLGSYIKYSTTPSDENQNIVTIKLIEYSLKTTGSGTTADPYVTVVDYTTGIIHDVQIGALDTTSKLQSTLTLDSAITLAEDQTKLVRMFVYMDGEDLTNADFLNDTTSFELNVQFKHSVELEEMVVSESDNGRTETHS